MSRSPVGRGPPSSVRPPLWERRRRRSRPMEVDRQSGAALLAAAAWEPTAGSICAALSLQSHAHGLRCIEGRGAVVPRVVRPRAPGQCRGLDEGTRPSVNPRSPQHRGGGHHKPQKPLSLSRLYSLSLSALPRTALPAIFQLSGACRRVPKLSKVLVDNSRTSPKKSGFAI